MIYLNIAEGCAPTGRLLVTLLTERGVMVTTPERESQAVVCWGNGYEGRKPSLNRNAARYNKLEQLQKLRQAELQTVPVATGNVFPATHFPAFMRKLSHSGGTDIRLALEPQQAEVFARNGWAYATKYIPSSTEFRVWVYRRQHLGTYEKVLSRQDEFLRSRHFGRNFDNGYSFQLVASENLPTAAIEMAKRAVDALGLDFGAVDILKGRDNQFYILEVNTAPGVEGPDRQVIQGLADKIARWVEMGYPRRNGDEAAYDRPNRPARTRTQAAAPAPAPEPLPVGGLPSFLPRRGESYKAWQRRVGV